MSTQTIFLSTEDYKAYCPQLHTHFPWAELSRLCDLAANKYLVPFIGEEYYAHLVNITQTSNLGEDGQVLDAARISLAFYAYADLIISHAIHASEAGIQEATPEDGSSRPAAKFARHDARAMALETADLYLDYTLLRLEKSLEADPTRHSTFRTSEAYTRLQSCLVSNSLHVWTEAPWLRSTRAIYLLRHDLLRIQQRDIKPLLTDTWYDDLLTRYADPAQAITAAENLLLPYLRTYLVRQTLYESLPTNRVEYTTNGLYFRTYDGPIENRRREASEASLRHLQSTLSEQAEQARISLRKYLDANANDFEHYTTYDFRDGQNKVSHKPIVRRGRGGLYL